MKVNFQNLTTAIQNGQTAFNSSDVGNPIDTGNIGFYDHPMSNLSEGGISESLKNPDAFTVGFSRWGGEDLVQK